MSELEKRVEKLEEDKGINTMKTLEDLQDRAFRKGSPEGMSGTMFTNYIRGLYPEYYLTPPEVKRD